MRDFTLGFGNEDGPEDERPIARKEEDFLEKSLNSATEVGNTIKSFYIRRNCVVFPSPTANLQLLRQLDTVPLTDERIDQDFRNAFVR